MLLSVEERAILASGLLASLDADDLDDAEVEPLWSLETQRRAGELTSGDVTPVSWEHVVARIVERSS